MSNILYIVMLFQRLSEQYCQFQTEFESNKTKKMYTLKSVLIYIVILLYMPIGAPVESGNYQNVPGIMLLWPNTKVLLGPVE